MPLFLALVLCFAALGCSAQEQTLVIEPGAVAGAELVDQMRAAFTRGPEAKTTILLPQSVISLASLRGSYRPASLIESVFEGLLFINGTGGPHNRSTLDLGMLGAILPAMRGAARSTVSNVDLINLSVQPLGFCSQTCMHFVCLPAFVIGC